ncbi:MAG: ABC transporter ATP-binding protein [Gemmatimonadota bacterium]
MAEPRPLFAAEGVGRSFGRRQVLKNASIWAWPGRITVLLGRNGCGKSTLLRCAVGQLRMDHGAVHFDGVSTLRPRLHRLAHRGLFFLPEIGMLPRRGRLRTHLAAAASGVAGGAERMAAALDELGLAAVLDNRTGQLSGGERRRADLAVALIRAPRCLLADEPFTGIQPNGQELVARTLRRLADGGAALVVTGHEVPLLLPLADQVVWMSAGTTHGLGSPEAAAAHDQFRREYLGPNAATGLRPPSGSDSPAPGGWSRPR